ncbi:sterol desaturase family protein [Parerythrobacter aestuarii]|uniref:sterol desaturase family protein n=1 Tax=Parerythrobacter aestuarii TaxID=3020909 RepID=UPI0024DE3116|nr:sterol desaturase family protein [Parerythrobacter aestuarii]
MLDTIYFDLSRYLITAGLVTLLLWAFGRWLEIRRIQKRHAKAEDYRREFLSSLRTVFVFSITTLSSLLMRETGLVRFSFETPDLTILALECITIIIAHDAYFYWMHRTIHHRRLFRTWHLHHHKSRTPTAWAAYSFSGWEAAAEAAFVPLFLLAATTLGVEYSGWAIFVFLWHMIFRNVIGHCGVEIYPRWWVDSPLTQWWNTVTHHDLHHSSGTWNFGLYFTWWDRWMGTEHPRYRETFREVTGRQEGRPGPESVPSQ